MNTRTDYGTDYTTAGNGNGNGAAGDTFAAAGPARSASEGRSTRSLIRELMRQSSSLARKEIALATGEMRENLMEARRDATAITTGGVVLAGGYILLLAAAAAVAYLCADGYALIMATRPSAALSASGAMSSTWMS